MTPSTDQLKLGLETANSSQQIATEITWDSSSECDRVPYAFHFATGMVIGCAGVLCIFGNILVLHTFARNTVLRTSSNLLIINLTIADFFMAITDFPMFAFSSLKGCWSLGFHGCQMYGTAASISGLVSINTLAAIAFDRYVAVVRRFSPIDRIAKSTIAIAIGIIWAVSIIWSVLPFTGIGVYRLEGMGTSCTFNYIDQRLPNKIFFLGLVTFNFFIPLVIICFSYSQIYLSVCQIKREIHLFQRRHSNASNTLRHQCVLRAEIKTAITAILIIVVFCITWTPYVVIAFVGMFHNASAITPTASMIPNIMAKLATASNAMLYSVSHPEIKKRIKKLLCYKSSADSYQRPTSASNQSSLIESTRGINMSTYL